MNEPIIKVTALRAYLKTTTGYIRAVDGIDFAIARGETLALLGESGSGKSITALSLLQLLPAQAQYGAESNINFAGINLLDQSEINMRNIRGRRIGMIFQEPMTALNPVLTIGQQIAEVLQRHFGLQGEALQARILELLHSVGIADGERRARQYPHELSGGMKQRIGIAIAIAAEPELLIADEPTTALDVTIQAQIIRLLRELQQRNGMAILLITHDLGVVWEMADHVAVMYAGHLLETAPAAKFFTEPGHPYSQRLFAAMPSMEKRERDLSVITGAVPSLEQEFTRCRFKDRCMYKFGSCETSKPRWINVSPDHAVRCHLLDPKIPGRPVIPAARENAVTQLQFQASLAPEIMQVQDLSVHFPIKRGLLQRTAAYVYAVDGVSISLRRGRTLAIVGESGCGKTTLGKAMVKLVQATAGRINMDKKSISSLSESQFRPHRHNIQMIFQDPFASLDPRMPITQVLQEGMRAQKYLKKNQRQLDIDNLLQQVGLAPEHKHRYPHEFSGGQRQRVAIARALAVSPRLIICDEPTSALDVSVQAQILNLLKKLQRELGLTYLFISHNIAVVAYMADEVAVMYLGRIVEQGGVDELLYKPKHPYTQALLSAVPKIGQQENGSELLAKAAELPSAIDRPSGCFYHPRCPHAMEICKKEYPPASQQGYRHITHCHLYTSELE